MVCIHRLEEGEWSASLRCAKDDVVSGGNKERAGETCSIYTPCGRARPEETISPMERREQYTNEIWITRHK
jgi:hypothetical protein